MKISCPDCQSSYEVNLPNLTEKGAQVECAKCQSSFLVIPEKSPVGSDTSPPDSSEAELDPENQAPDEDNLDDMLDQLIDEEFENNEKNEDNSDLDDGLDNMLDDLISGEVQTSTEETQDLASADSDGPELDNMLDDLISGEVQTGTEETQDLASADSDGPELDNMLDDLISGEVQTSTEETQDLASADSDGPELDNMLDDLISGDKETSTEEDAEETPLDLGEGEEPELDTMADDATNDKTEPDLLKNDEASSDDEDLDGLLDDILNDDEAEDAEPSPPVAEAEKETTTDEPEASVDDILNKIAPDSEPEENHEDTDSDTEIAEEPAAEAQDTSPSDDAPTPLEEMSEEDMWAEAFADQDTTEKGATEETAEAPVEEEKSEEDMWAEAFADQDATEKGATEETAEAPVEEEKSEEDMWAEAFADQDATEKDATEETAAEDEDEDEDEEQDAAAELGISEDDYPDEEDEGGEDEEQDAAAELGISEDDYPDEDEEDYDEGEEEGERIKIGPISVPATRTGKLMLAGGVLGLLVTAGGAYFAWQTFAPPELAKVTKPESEVPEGLTPKPGKEQAPEVTEPKTEKVDTKLQKPEKSSAPAIPGETREEKKSDIAQELAGSKTLSDATETVEVVKEESAGLRAALSPEAKMVKLSTIMPVAFDINDIRVLSFTLEITFTDEDSAKVMQSALPLFEETTVKTIEKFLAKKFYNDILYVKEKLEKRLQTAYNNRIDSEGRVKKIKFEDFLIQ